MSRICRTYIVHGRVQKVGFRLATKRQAKLLGITGTVCNQSDGTVAVVACGEVPRLSRLHDWLLQGSPQARVNLVEVCDQAFQSYDQFSVISD